MYLYKAAKIFSDPWRIGENLRNLISNAIKYRKLNNVSCEVSIQIAIDDQQASIRLKIMELALVLKT